MLPSLIKTFAAEQTWKNVLLHNILQNPNVRKWTKYIKTKFLTEKLEE